MSRLLLAIAFSAVTFQARADDVLLPTQLQSTWSGETLFFQKFDPTLGTLLRVDVSASADVGMLLTFRENINSPWILQVQEDFRVSGDPFYQPYGVFERIGQSATAGAQIDAVANVPISFVLTTNLSPYIGNDLWTTTVSGDSFIYVPNDNSFSQGPLEITNLSVSVDYQYVPAVVTPEPRWAGMLLIGLTLLAVQVVQATSRPQPRCSLGM